MAAAHKYGEPKVVDRITIRRWTGTHWMRHSRPTKRPLDTLFLPADTVRGVVDDLTDFLGGEADYARFGRPYKRVYLLSGAPGLGKSSLALALAGHFDMDLYVYAIDDESTDQGLGAAVSAADAPCVLLIEDVDAAGTGGKSHLTLSGLTNVLDGAQTRHGVAVFLTTNYPDRLDAALTRSGRVDKWLRFDAATADQITAMVKHYFASQFASDLMRSRSARVIIIINISERGARKHTQWPKECCGRGQCREATQQGACAHRRDTGASSHLGGRPL
ncbi:AAA+ ATPase [Pandoravirus inopinatum]|uniref:AAA+ ATPase n=1 Tax=Pandoravirus inopinatum TaxID=1605721 RepID=A0A0B5IZJ3_9VIRU|nr:AAA+ ATPase [Pandoravirus inopinatum]AJF98323.1 AAA+ ATPase [Pandoravirus inopinatum]